MNTFLKLIITLLAILVIVVRILKPEIKIDSITLFLLVMAIIPWLSDRIETLELPGGFKMTLRRDSSRTRTQGPRGPRSFRLPGGFVIQFGDSGIPTSPRPDSFADTALKITPVETIVTFIFTNAILTQLPASGLQSILIWLNFLVLLFATSFYLTLKGVEKRSQVILSTLVFVIWAYIIGGPFALLQWYEPFYAALLLAIFTFIIPSFAIR